MLREVILSVPLLLMSAVAMAQPKPAYLVAEYDITDAARFQKFGVASNSAVKAYGGEFLSRRNKPVSAVGDPPKNVTIVMFPSMEKAQAYLSSAEYKAIVPDRDAGAKFRSFVVQGGDLATQ